MEKLSIDVFVPHHFLFRNMNWGVPNRGFIASPLCLHYPLIQLLSLINPLGPWGREFQGGWVQGSRHKSGSGEETVFRAEGTLTAQWATGEAWVWALGPHSCPHFKAEAVQLCRSELVFRLVPCFPMWSWIGCVCFPQLCFLIWKVGLTLLS